MKEVFETRYPQAFLLAETPLRERFVFTVRGSSQQGTTGGKRVLVYLLRDGSWRCRSCAARDKCHHKQFAEEYAQAAEIVDTNGGLSTGNDSWDDTTQEIANESESVSTVPAAVKQPVSYIPVPVPLWCRLPSDALDYQDEPPEIPPHLIHFGNNARCCCGATPPTEGANSHYWVPFTVFGLRKAYRCQIEVLDCLDCGHRRRQYGPDCGDIGVFNWNNTFGFTHELLNQYSNVFTTAANPFVSFVTSTRRLYIANRSPMAFCSIETFTRVWFAFTDLQPLDSGMECPICGKHPDIVIPDGVSIGYATKKFKQGLHPPSLVTNTNPINVTVKNMAVSEKAAISSRELRKEVKDLTATKYPVMGQGLSASVRNVIPALTSLVEYYSTTTPSGFQSALRELLRQVRHILLDLHDHIT